MTTAKIITIPAHEGYYSFVRVQFYDLSTDEPSSTLDLAGVAHLDEKPLPSTGKLLSTLRRWSSIQRSKISLEERIDMLLKSMHPDSVLPLHEEIIMVARSYRVDPMIIFNGLAERLSIYCAGN